MKIASSYPDKIEGEAQEKLYELWQAHDYEFNGKLEWLLAGLEHLGRKSERLLPNPKVFVRLSSHDCLNSAEFANADNLRFSRTASHSSTARSALGDQRRSQRQ